MHPTQTSNVLPITPPVQPGFIIRNCGDVRENGVFSTRGFSRSALIARLSGTIVHSRSLHTLQISEGIHLYDPDFVGLFLHSCSPNVHVDMQRFTVHAIQDISPGEALCMDYSSTEDILHRQFPCLCKSPVCREWITGRREPINAQGVRYLNALEATVVR